MDMLETKSVFENKSIKKADKPISPKFSLPTFDKPAILNSGERALARSIREYDKSSCIYKESNKEYSVFIKDRLNERGIIENVKSFEFKNSNLLILRQTLGKEIIIINPSYIEIIEN